MDLVNEFQWPIKYKFQYLRMTCYLEQPPWEMIDRSPDLKTLVLEEKSDISTYFHDRPGECLIPSCPQLTSLTLLNFSLPMNYLESLLSQTPSLHYLKIVTRSQGIMGGSRWKDFIKAKLPFLNKFEFYTRSYRYGLEQEIAASVLNEMIAPFRTLFWTEEKGWLVICNVFPTRREAEIYTSPICISLYTHMFDPQTMMTSNFEREDQHSALLESVNELHLDLRETSTDHRVSKPKLLLCDPLLLLGSLELI